VWPLSRARPRAPRNEGDYQEMLAVWQISHDADSHDFTIEQRRRFAAHNRLLNAGLDVARVGFARWQAENGRYDDDR
jgi:hypothetical protein